MTRILHITTQAEPTELHGITNSEQKSVYGVSLAWQNQMMGEIQGMENTKNFLKKIQCKKKSDEEERKGNFYVYAVKKFNNKYSIAELADAKAERVFKPNIEKGIDIVSWLDNCRRSYSELSNAIPQQTSMEKRLHKLLNYASALLALARDPEFLISIDKTKINDDSTVDPRYPAKIFNWIAQAATISTFDVTIIGLLLPQSNHGDTISIQSSLLKRLVRLFALKLEEKNPSLEVDIDVLYKNLHDSLKTYLEKLTPSKLWNDLFNNLNDPSKFQHIEKALTATLDDGSHYTVEEWEENAKKLTDELALISAFAEYGQDNQADSFRKDLLINIIDQVFGEDGRKDETIIDNTKIPDEEQSWSGIKDAFTAFKDQQNYPKIIKELYNDFRDEVSKSLPGDIDNDDNWLNLYKSDPYNRRFLISGQKDSLLEKLLAVGVRPTVSIKEDILDILKSKLASLGNNRIDEVLQTPFYVAKTRKLADMRNMTAFDLLQSTVKWPAPLAQNAGLLTAVEVQNLDHEVWNVFVFIPVNIKKEDLPQKLLVWKDEEWLKDSETQNKKLYLETPWLKPEYSDEQETIITASEILTQYENVEKRLKNGKFEIPANAGQQHELLQLIEEQAPALFWPATAFLSIASDKEFLDGFNDKEESFVFNCIARAATVSLFDIIFTGLLHPEPVLQSNGDVIISRRSLVLERLVRFISSRFEEKDHTLDVKEEILYVKLYEPLKKFINNLDPSGLWCLLPVDIKARLLKIQEILKCKNLYDSIIEKEMKKEMKDMFFKEVNELALFLESETGGESFLLRIFDKTFGTDGELINYEGTGIPEVGEEEEIKTAIKAAYEGFRNDIKSEFNAPEALRRDVGAEIVAALLTKGDSDGKRMSIKEVLEASNPFIYRLGINPTMKPPTPLDLLLANGIPYPLPQDQPVGLQKKLEDKLKITWMGRKEEILKSSIDAELFRPCQVPQPLYLQIGDSPKPDVMDKIAETTSGLGFLICWGENGGKKQAVHANLIGLEKNGESLGDPIVKRTVDPTLPIFTGRTSGLFVPYKGTPLSSPNLPEPYAGQADAELEAGLVAKDISPYMKTEADYPDKSQTPSLAYGKCYGVAAFWLPYSGVLPVALRKDQKNPFEPIHLLDNNGEDSFRIGAIKLKRYRRCTVGSEMEVAEISDLSVKPGIPEKVHPLAMDAPRIVLEGIKEEKGRRWIDIYRLADGTGALTKADNKITLFDIATELDLNNSHENKLTIEALSHPTSKNSRKLTFELKKNNLEICLDNAPEDKVFWLRLTLQSENKALSFSDPGYDKNQNNAERHNQVFLLAPQDNSTSSKWSIPSERDFTISLPGVSFQDAECWASNTALWVDTCNKDDQQDPKYAKKILTALRTAYYVWCENLENGSEKNKKQTFSLPDPAVKGLLIGVSISDRTASGVKTESKTIYIPLAPYALAESDLNGLPDPDKWPDNLEYQKLKEIASKAEKCIQKIMCRSKISLSVSVSNDDSKIYLKDNGDRDITLTLPEGCVAQLWVSPAIPENYFSEKDDVKHKEVMHKNMTQLSVGEYKHNKNGTCLLFDGAKLVFETMIDIGDNTQTKSDKEDKEFILKLKPESLDVEKISASRSYKLFANVQLSNEDATVNERIFSECELLSQRWYFLGFPISNWISPLDDFKDNEKGSILSIHSNNLVGELKTKFDDFECSAFGSRTLNDSDRLRIRLSPRPEKTELFSFSWPERSATYLRHALISYSRYNGALKNTQNRCLTDSWAVRIAILANPLGAPLTRPQLRAFLPVLRKVADNEEATTLPLSCILSEPPYSQLGLAERLDADIQTINTYSITEIISGDKKEQKLALDGLRKQVGPDPLLSALPIKDELSLNCTILPEGTVGLHFDTPQATLPAWSNSQFMLNLQLPVLAGNEKPDPNNITPEELEESFVAIALSRYADPGWCWIPSDPQLMNKTTTLPTDRDLWIQTTDDTITLVERNPHNPDKKVVVVIKAKGVEVNSSALFKDGGEQLIPVWNQSVDAVLLKPYGDGRFRLSIYKKPAGTEPEGKAVNNHPYQLVASVEFFTSGSLSIEGSSSNRIKITRQSEPTFVEWAKTARDLSSFICKKNGQCEPISIEEIKPVIEEIESDSNTRMQRLVVCDSEKNVLQLMPPVYARHTPLHVHRRLVYILRRPSQQTGHEISLFHKALLANSWGAAEILSNQDSKREVKLELSIAELEMRSEILLIKNNSSLSASADCPIEKYKTAYFDLKSIIPENNQIGMLKFHIRLVKDFLSLDNNFKIIMKTNNDDDPFEITIDEIIENVNSLDLVLPSNGEPKLIYNNAAKDGERSSIEIKNNWPVTMADSITMTIENNQDNECWVDISMLHSQIKNTDDEFDFDWLFGIPKEETVSEAMKPETLNKLTEAQARIIGISDPIPVTIKKKGD